MGATYANEDNMHYQMQPADGMVTEVIENIMNSSNADNYMNNSMVYYSYGSEESEELIPPSQITFWSLPRVLPSEKESCSLDNINRVE